MDFADLKQRILEVHDKFPRKYDAKTEYVNLVEEVGELANAILLESGDKPEKRRRAELADSFADVLFALVVTAESYKVDLEKELVQTLGEIDNRLQEKEYEDEQ